MDAWTDGFMKFKPTNRGYIVPEIVYSLLLRAMACIK